MIFFCSLYGQPTNEICVTVFSISSLRYNKKLVEKNDKSTQKSLCAAIANNTLVNTQGVRANRYLIETLSLSI